MAFAVRVWMCVFFEEIIEETELQNQASNGR